MAATHLVTLACLLVCVLGVPAPAPSRQLLSEDLFVRYNLDVPSEVSAKLPKFATLLGLAQDDPEALATLLRNSPLAAIAPRITVPEAQIFASEDSTPIVAAHGMGDSCFNPGMKSVAEAAGKYLGVYSTCIPTGDSQVTDTIDGFLLNMDASVDAFAKKVRADPQLKNGFNAFGLSQGNNVIRGYITKYNDPPVKTFMSICGINAGVAAFPHCSPQIPALGLVCEVVSEVLGDLAYMKFVQEHLFQANYYRDARPERRNSTEYVANAQLAKWNNEHTINQDYVSNFLKTSKFVWIQGTKDTMVWPREGEWWGAPSLDNPYHSVVPMNQTEWYTKDLFGLQTADKTEGMNNFDSFDGEHIQFTEQELFAWLKKYF